MKIPIDVGEGYRLINKDVDQPHEDDQIYNEYCQKWQKRDSTFINEPYARVNIYRRALPTAALSEPQRKLIPFNGAGQYRLNNGKIVNLNDSCCCKYEDGIMSTSGNVLNWSWNKDGSINGPFADLEGLSLAEKMAVPSEPQKNELPVEPSVVSEKPPKAKVVYYKPLFKDNTLFIKRVGNKLGFVYKDDLNPNLPYFWGASDEREVREGRWVEITQGDVDKILAALSEPQRSESPVESSVVPKELPPLPILNSSDGYKFLLSSGEPVFRKPNDGDYFVKYNYATKKYGPIVKSKNFSVPWGVDERRYIVVPSEQEKIPVVPKEKPIGTAIASYTMSFLTKGKSYNVYGQEKDLILVKDNSGNKHQYAHKAFDAVLISAIPMAPKESFESDISLSDNIVSGADSTKEEEDIIMQKETAIKVANSVTRFAGRWGFKTANYWLFEPVKEVASKIMRSVRYVFLGSALVGGIYAYNDPQAAKDFFWDCIPSISISFEAPEILNG